MTPQSRGVKGIHPPKGGWKDNTSIFNTYGRWLVGYDGFITANYSRSDYRIDF